MRSSISIGLLACALVLACSSAPPTVEDPPAALPDSGQEVEDAGTSDGGTKIRRIVSLEVTPKSLDLKVGAISGVTAVATFDDGSKKDVTGTVQWSAQPAGIIEVEVLSSMDNLARVETLTTGVAQISAQTGNIVSDGCTVTVSDAVASDGGTAAPEVRAIWVTRFAYNTKPHVESIIAKAADAGFNVVYFQIRGNGDAYYQSQLVPWAQKLSGTLGQDPGWDPLQVAIDAAHARGLELHAYWNVHAAWPCSGAACDCRPEQGMSDSCTLPPASPSGMPNHILRDHPEYMAVLGTGKNASGSEYFWFSPGNPDVKAHLLAVADELITNYEIDGLHLDRVRYAGSGYSQDAASLAAYNAIPSAQRPTYADWQRAQVSETVGAIYELLKQKRPNAVLSAAVWGIYKKLPGCSTSEGYSGYYQDSIGWMKNGQIDVIVPMTYWDIGTGCTDWAKLMDGFLAGSNGRPVIAGMHALENDDRVHLDRINARVDYARTIGAAGTAIFASTYLNANGSGQSYPEQWSNLSADGGPFTEPAPTPPIDWR